MKLSAFTMSRLQDYRWARQVYELSESGDLELAYKTLLEAERLARSLDDDLKELTALDLTMAQELRDSRPATEDWVQVVERVLDRLDDGQLMSVGDVRARVMRKRAAVAREARKATCVHPVWDFLYTGRHGSENGIKHYECRNCGARKGE